MDVEVDDAEPSGKDAPTSVGQTEHRRQTRANTNLCHFIVKFKFKSLSVKVFRCRIYLRLNIVGNIVPFVMLLSNCKTLTSNIHKKTTSFKHAVKF